MFQYCSRKNMLVGSQEDTLVKSSTILEVVSYGAAEQLP